MIGNLVVALGLAALQVIVLIGLSALRGATFHGGSGIRSRAYGDLRPGVLALGGQVSLAPMPTATVPESDRERR